MLTLFMLNNDNSGIHAFYENFGTVLLILY